MDNMGPINKYLFNTLSAGKVKVRLNIGTQSKKVKTDERVNYKAQKLSEQTEQKKKEMGMSNLPSFVNTGNVLGSRFTNNKL